MTLLDRFRWLRAEHEQTRPLAIDRFARDSLEHMMSLFTDLESDVALIKTKLIPLLTELGPLLPQLESLAGKELGSLEDLLPANVRQDLADVHSLAELVATLLGNVTPATPVGTLAIDVQLPAETPNV